MKLLAFALMVIAFTAVGVRVVESMQPAPVEWQDAECWREDCDRPLWPATA